MTSRQLAITGIRLIGIYYLLEVITWASNFLYPGLFDGSSAIIIFFLTSFLIKTALIILLFMKNWCHCRNYHSGNRSTSRTRNELFLPAAFFCNIRGIRIFHYYGYPALFFWTNSIPDHYKRKLQAVSIHKRKSFICLYRIGSTNHENCDRFYTNCWYQKNLLLVDQVPRLGLKIFTRASWPFSPFSINSIKFNNLTNQPMRYLFALVISLCWLGLQAQNHTLASPDNKIKVTVTPGDPLSYSISLNGNLLMTQS